MDTGTIGQTLAGARVSDDVRASYAWLPPDAADVLHLYASGLGPPDIAAAISSPELRATAQLPPNRDRAMDERRVRHLLRRHRVPGERAWTVPSLGRFMALIFSAYSPHEMALNPAWLGQSQPIHVAAVVGFAARGGEYLWIDGAWVNPAAGWMVQRMWPPPPPGGEGGVRLRGGYVALSSGVAGYPGHFRLMMVREETASGTPHSA